MNFFRQVFSITGMSLAAIPHRLGASLVVVIGIAGVVGVIISILALTTGLQHVMTGNARADRVVVLSKNASSPGASQIPRASVPNVIGAPGIKVGSDGKPIAGGLAIAPMQLHDNRGKRANVPMIGATPAYFQGHPEVKLIEGRMYEQAVREVIAGRQAVDNYPEVKLGNHIKMREGEWTVVGIYRTGGDTLESYLIGDLDTVMSAYRRSTVNVVDVILNSPEAFDQFTKAVTSDPAIQVDSQRETDVLANGSKQLNSLLHIIAYGIGGIMAVGAIFGALNTMYTSVSGRTLEIATLRAIGFGGAPVAISVVVEGLLLGFAGALVGASAAWLLFHDKTISSTFGTGTQIETSLIVTPGLVMTGILWALVIGLIGGLFPAIRAARLPVATALQVR